MVLLLVDCKRLVKIPQGFTSAYAPQALTTRMEPAKILMSVRGKIATRMQSVVTAQGVFLVLVTRRVMKATATRNALTLMNAKLLLIRYCTHVVFYVTIALSCDEVRGVQQPKRICHAFKENRRIPTISFASICICTLWAGLF